VNLLARLPDCPVSRDGSLAPDQGHADRGTIRRVRQTLLATNLADGALVAWKVPDDKLDGAFSFMFRQDSFSVMSFFGQLIRKPPAANTVVDDNQSSTGLRARAHTNILLKKVSGEK